MESIGADRDERSGDRQTGDARFRKETIRDDGHGVRNGNTLQRSAIPEHDVTVERGEPTLERHLIKNRAALKGAIAESGDALWEINLFESFAVQESPFAQSRDLRYAGEGGGFKIATILEGV